MPIRTLEKPPLPGLTSLRFFAAAYTLLYHTRGNLVWFRAGYTGVTLFFVLSGFVLAYNYPNLRPGHRRSFYIARLARIYPLYFVAMLLMLPWYVRGLPNMGVPFYLRSTALYLLLLQTWFPTLRNAISAGAWTMPVEAFFYLLFPFVVPWFGRMQRHWVGTLAVLWGVMLLLAFFLDLYLIPHHPARETLIHQIFSVPLFHLEEFLIGIVLGLRYLHRRPVFRGWHVLAATAFCVIVLAADGPGTFRDNEILMNGSMALPYGLLIYAVAGFKSRVLSHPLLQLGGEISYSMYLLQWVLVQLVQTALQHMRSFVPLRFGLFLFFCFLSYQFIEKPGRRLILRLFNIHSHPKPIETPDPALP
jgi:peptidoglycan/LPS O-acetylase OafA/YrhL